MTSPRVAPHIIHSPAHHSVIPFYFTPAAVATAKPGRDVPQGWWWPVGGLSEARCWADLAWPRLGAAGAPGHASSAISFLALSSTGARIIHVHAGQGGLELPTCDGSTRRQRAWFGSPRPRPWPSPGQQPRPSQRAAQPPLAPPQPPRGESPIAAQSHPGGPPKAHPGSTHQRPRPGAPRIAPRPRGPVRHASPRHAPPRPPGPPRLVGPAPPHGLRSPATFPISSSLLHLPTLPGRLSHSGAQPAYAVALALNPGPSASLRPADRRANG